MNDQLILAATTGDVARVKSLLTMDADINVTKTVPALLTVVGVAVATAGVAETPHCYCRGRVKRPCILRFTAGTRMWCSI